MNSSNYQAIIDLMKQQQTKNQFQSGFEAKYPSMINNGQDKFSNTPKIDENIYGNQGIKSS